MIRYIIKYAICLSILCSFLDNMLSLLIHTFSHITFGYVTFDHIAFDYVIFGIENMTFGHMLLSHPIEATAHLKSLFRSIFSQVSLTNKVRN